jgi:thiopeptide-type bacteriocin biosynthesis protein
MRRLIDAIVANVRRAGLDHGEWSAEDLAQLADLQERFIVAGAEHLERSHNPARWLQYGLRFQHDDQRIAFLAGPLRKFVRKWLSGAGADRFFFMAKPPGLRLRFRGRMLERTLGPALQRLLERERQAGRLAGYEPGIYDMETYQFGGQVGLEIAHEFATYDSVAILDLLSHRTAADLLPLLSLTVLNDLAKRLCEDGWELWDAWRSLELAQRSLSPDAVASPAVSASFEEQRELVEQSLSRPDVIQGQLPARIRRVVVSYFDNNARVAERLAAAARSGELLYGVRKIFPFYVVFHWNRWLISREMQLTLTYFMQRLLDPKRAEP